MTPQGGSSKSALAAVLPAVGTDIEIQPVPMPEPTTGEVVVGVEYGGVCGTDLHLQRGHLPVPTPLVLGHEGLGVITDAGPGAEYSDGTPVEVGRRVMWASSIACGQCWHCRVAREPTLCEARRTYGVNRAMCDSIGPAGSWSEAMILESGTAIVPLPGDVDALDAMAFACAGPTVLHAFDERRHVRAGETVVIQGCGPVGMAAAMYAQDAGAETVIVVGAPSHRLSLASQLGIGHHHIDFTERAVDELLAEVASLTPGRRGADLVVECTGVPAAVDQGLQMCRRGGSYLVVGQYTDAGPAPINPHAIVHRQLDVYGSWAFGGPHLERYVATFPALRRYQVGRLVTEFPLSAANEAIAAVAEGTVVKAVLAVG
jgi:threonine dehydrogenase-like Zn-dependent dehydrogenase